MRSKQLFIAFFGLVVCGLTGCSSTPQTALSRDIAINEKVSGAHIDDAFERRRLSVLASDLQDAEKKRQTYEAFISDPIVVEALENPASQQINGAPVAQIIGDSIAGGFNSNLGTGLVAGLALWDIGSAIIDAAKTNYIQKGYVPNSFNGIAIDNEKEAREFLLEQFKSSLEQFAKTNNLTVRCITTQCNSYAGVFELDVANLKGDFVYKQDKVYVNYFMPYLFKERANPVRDLALGFKAEYGQKDLANFHISIWSELVRDENNEILLTQERYHDLFNFDSIYGKEITKTLLAQKVLSGIYSNPFMLMTMDAPFMNRLFYNKHVYIFNKHNDAEEGLVDTVLHMEKIHNDSELQQRKSAP